MKTINKKSIFAVGLMLAMLAFSPMVASADTNLGINQTDYNRLSTNEKVAFLMGMISQLQALFDLNEDSYDYGVIYVSSGSSRNSSDRIDVDTLTAADIRDDEADLRGRVDLNRERSATVWFEYGDDDDDLDERTLKRTVKDSGGEVKSFTHNADDLRDDEKYYFRAVAEDDDGDRAYGSVRSFTTDDEGGRRNGDDEPDVDTEAAKNVDEDSAELNGSVDMNDFNNGQVFFVYGEDEDQVEDIAGDYDSYSDVDEDGDDLQKILIDSDLDSDDDYDFDINNLDEDTEYYFSICVEYEDEDDDDVVECGSVRDFTTDDEGNSSSGDFELDVSDYSVDEGDRVEVDWEISSRDEGSQNWIGLYEIGDDDRNYTNYRYLSDDDSGTVTFTMNYEGVYEFRLFLDNSYDEEITSKEVEVD